MTADQCVWRSLQALTVLALIGPLVLVAALVVGWNSSCPPRLPDGQVVELSQDVLALPGETTVLVLDHVEGDFGLEVEVLPIAGPDSGFDGYGLVFQAQSAASYLVLAVGSDGYYAVLRTVGGDEVPLVSWQQFPHVRRGRQVNRLRVACVGSVCDFYINDEYATTIEQEIRLTGDVGLWVRSFGGEGVTVRCLSARIWCGGTCVEYRTGEMCYANC
ncbi:MAG TPA: hypothetical protein ENN99_00740 [Chloroflexi bacterium]|nr:hypothetical protein [Chloroflexota bacterium]